MTMDIIIIIFITTITIITVIMGQTRPVRLHEAAGSHLCKT